MTVILTAAILGSCGHKDDSSQPPVVELQSYSYDVISEQTGDTIPTDAPGARYWRSTGSGVLPVRIGDRDITQLRDTLMKLGSVEFDGETAKARIADDRRLTSLDPAKTDACSYGDHTMAIVTMTPRLIVWRCYNEYYLCMAAHGSYSTTFINYDIVRDKVIELADIMKPGYKDTLTRLLRQALSERDDLLEDLSEIGIPDEFKITPTGIRFLYGIYEIAPYSSGEIGVDIPTYEIDDILNDNGKALF